MMKRCGKLVICIAVFCSIDTSIGMASIGMESIGEESENRINISNNIGSKYNINLKDNIGIGSISQSNINDSTCMESKDQISINGSLDMGNRININESTRMESQDQINITDIFGSENKNSIVNYDDCKSKPAELEHELNCCKERIQLKRQALREVEERGTKVQIPRYIWQTDPNVNSQIKAVRSAVANHAWQKSQNEKSIPAAIKKCISDEGTLDRIIHVSQEVYYQSVKLASDKQRILQSDIYQINKQIEEAQKEEKALKDESQCLLIIAIQTGLLSILDASNKKNLGQLLSENDNLKKERDEQNAKLDAIKQSNKSLKADIFALKKKLLKWIPNVPTYC